MSDRPQPLWGPTKRQRPGIFSLQCGLILLVMGFTSFEWNRRLIEGPADEQLRPVQATLLSIDCEVRRGSSYGAAHSSQYGKPVVNFEYMYNGQLYRSQRYSRQRNTTVGSMAECRELADRLRAQPLVEAWADSAKPEFAILSKQLRPQSLSGIFMGIGTALAVLGVYRLIRSRGWKRDHD